MITNVIQRLRTRRDARLYERTFLRARRSGETCAQAATRLYCDGRDEAARAYELLDQKFPGLYADNQNHSIDQLQITV